MVNSRKKPKTAKHFIEGFQKILDAGNRPSCPNSECGNFKKEVPDRIIKKGVPKSKQGNPTSQRFECLDCGTKFTDKREKGKFRNPIRKEQLSEQFAKKDQRFKSVARALGISQDTLTEVTRDLAHKEADKALLDFALKPPKECWVVELEVSKNKGFKAVAFFFFVPGRQNMIFVNASALTPHSEQNRFLESFARPILDPEKKIVLKVFGSKRYLETELLEQMPYESLWPVLSEELGIQNWVKAKSFEHLKERLNLFMVAYNRRASENDL